MYGPGSVYQALASPQAVAVWGRHAVERGSDESIQKVISLQMERRAISLSNKELRALVTGGMASLQEQRKG